VAELGMIDSFGDSSLPTIEQEINQSRLELYISSLRLDTEAEEMNESYSIAED